MVKEEAKPYGFIYEATNRQTGKKYVGQTVTSKWKSHQVPIEARWKKEVDTAYAKNRRGEHLRDIERTIVEYGPENFDLKEQDVANNQQELDDKEIYWIKEYDLMNPEKGYNMTPGGHGGRPSPEVIDHISNEISDKWQEDKEYREKQIKERQERAQDPEWVAKMTEINQERANDPEWVAKMTEINQEYLTILIS